LVAVIEALALLESEEDLKAKLLVS